MSTALDSANKRIVKNSALLYVRMFITLCISLYTSRAFLDALGAEDYGIYNVVAGFVSLLSIITSTITSATQRFITYEIGTGNKEKLKDTFSTFIIVLLGIGVFIFLLGEIIGTPAITKYLVIPEERLSAAVFVYHCALIAFVLRLISAPYTADVTAHERFNFYAYVSIGESVAKLFFAISLYYIPFDLLKVYALYMVLTELIIRIIYRVYCKKRFEETRWKFVVKKDIVIEVFSYSIWVTLGASSSILKEQGVNVLINRFFGVLLNAARGVSMQVYSVVNQFSANIGSAIIPQITKSYASGDVQRSIKLTCFLAKSQGLVLFLVSLPLLLETEYILNLWLKDVPDYACVFTRWALILCLARTLENTHVPLYLATGKVRNLQLVGGGLMLLNLPLSYVVLKLGFEAVSTMIVGVIIELVVMYVAFLFLKKLVGFPIGQFYGKIIIPMVIVFVLSTILPFIVRLYLLPEGFLRLIIVSVLSVLSTIFFAYTISLSKSEREMVLTIIKNKLLKKV